MTTISPTYYASQLATKAQQSLDAASTLLLSVDITPMPGIGIPELHGPDSPDNPWFVGPGGSDMRTPYGEAARRAGEAVADIDRALALGQGDLLGRDVLSAFSRAREQAVAGVAQLRTPTPRPVIPGDVALQFDGAKLWLGLAKNLIALQDNGGGGPVPMPHPPVTVPTPMPHPIDPRIPTEPITIQLPPPGSEIQVEAPEAMSR